MYLGSRMELKRIGHLPLIFKRNSTTLQKRRQVTLLFYQCCNLICRFGIWAVVAETQGRASVNCADESASGTENTVLRRDT